jgi:hypothetical protein
MNEDVAAFVVLSALELSIFSCPARKRGNRMGGRSRTRFSPTLEIGRLAVGSPIRKAAEDISSGGL